MAHLLFTIHHSPLPIHYHYIITGAGCAGSSLLMRMMQEDFFRDKKILVLDHSAKNSNDRTWCFWEKEAGLFESIVYHRWSILQFYSDSFFRELSIEPYQYKMIRGIDLYDHVRQMSAQHANIEWRNEMVKKVETGTGHARVVTDQNEYRSEYVFNSIPFRDVQIPPSRASSKAYYLLQHFKGWLIETPGDCFDAGKATFMDFRVSQEKGVAFFYVLPVSPRKALVEYTLFTEQLLSEEMYDAALREYISSYLQQSDYSVQHTEFGVIPMTNLRFPLQEGRVVFTGIAGGQAKGSSGYAFRFIQKRTAAIVDSLVHKNSVDLRETMADKKFRLYDSVLLHVLHHRKMAGSEVFARIFQHNPPQRVLRFLDNETTLWDDLRIMRSVPAGIFLPAAIQELGS